jgi:RNA recognition motif-containing protein
VLKGKLEMSSHEEKRRKWWLKQLKRKSKQQSPEPVELPQEEEEDDESCADKELTGKKRRYILFVGNLSYSTTADEIQEQFMKRGVPIQQVRLLTHKDTNKSRGCCFLEFTQAKHQQVTSQYHNNREFFFKSKKLWSNTL